MDEPLILWRWWITDERTGKRRLTSYRMTEKDALERYPDAEHEPSSERSDTVRVGAAGCPAPDMNDGRLAVRVRIEWFFVLCAVAAAPCLAQTVFDLDAQRETASAKLREAIVGLRDVRRQACALRGGDECDLAALSAAELLLYDLESKARRSRRAAASSTAEERLKKIEDAASEAREKVSDLGDLIKPDLARVRGERLRFGGPKTRRSDL